MKTISLLKTISHLIDISFGGVITIIIILALIQMTIKTRGKINIAKTPCHNQLSRKNQFWQESHRGRWTYKLIPELTEWADCEHKTVDYHMTQFLTDHGCFRGCLFRFVDTAQCLYCTDAVETAEHFLLHCSRFVEERAQLVALAGSPLSPSGLVAAMMAVKIVWDGAHVIIVTMMKRVRKDELANRNYR
ncbi:GM11157 [Drosophila sechellia]|uniref:GM11157 n=1 Tax=Drosophila sechellia TaxID=7238 RepID=B4IM91_DROSE|nr:GM11157 [Drosophila sechellia]